MERVRPQARYNRQRAVYREPRDGNGAAIAGDPATGIYTYTFPDNSVRVSDGYVDNVVVRMIVEVRSLPLNLFVSDPSDPFTTTRPRDGRWMRRTRRVRPDGGGTGVPLVLGDGSPGRTTSAPRRATPATIRWRSTAAPAGITSIARPATTPSSRPARSTNSNLVNLVHKIHNHQTPGAQNIGDLGDFNEVTYPQDIRNCTTCHQGTEADNTYANWTNKPTTTACGSCHINVNFTTGAGHVGGRAADRRRLRLRCHPAAPASRAYARHREHDAQQPACSPARWSTFEYEIDNVTVDNTNTATIKFWIKNGTTDS